MILMKVLKLDYHKKIACCDAHLKCIFLFKLDKQYL